MSDRRVKQQAVVFRTTLSFKFELLRVNTKINGKKLLNLLDRTARIQFSLLMGVVVQLMGLTNEKELMC